MINEIDIINEDNYAEAEDVTPQDILKFAKMILLSILGLFILSIFVKSVSNDTIIFETCKTVLPPIATLVIGFYFGKN